MSGTKAGGQKAAKTNVERHGKDFYRRIGQKGGSHSTNGGFASDKIGADGLTGRERARLVGKIGGSISKRGAKKEKDDIDKAEDVLRAELKDGRDL